MNRNPGSLSGRTPTQRATRRHYPSGLTATETGMEMQAPPLSLPSFVVLVRSWKLGGAVVVAAGERDAETGCGTCRIPFLVFFFFRLT